MAILSSTGINGFLCSCKNTGRKLLNQAGELIPEYASTFVSGVSGWLIDKLGNAEFKTLYCRDKFITNEFVYNRIKVTEDEEIISSSLKIASVTDNEDGTYAICPDLREGDVNPLSKDDLVIGYYHNPANSGVVYAVQKMTVQSGPDAEQSIILTCEEGSYPYPHMIIVRVGNLIDENRQSFIRISSRTNCQYFYDGINSWAAYDGPEQVRCVLGKADIGLIPAWAVSAVGAVKKWFGLIADGVILRGTFILKSSNKTIESELDGVGETITELETRFEIKEGQISSSVKEVKTYTAKASDFADAAKSFAGNAAGSASDANKALTAITEKESNITQTAEGITAKVSQIDKLVDDASDTLLSITEKASEVKQTADGFQSTVTEVTTKAVTDAVTGVESVIEEKVGTAVTQSAREWKVEVLGGEDTVLASINADESGIKIKGDKVGITGTLLAQIIMATGLNIDDKFIVKQENDETNVTIKGKMKTADTGQRLEMDPETQSFKFYDKQGDESINIQSSTNGDAVMELLAKKYGDTPRRKTRMSGGEIMTDDGNTTGRNNTVTIWPNGIRINDYQGSKLDLFNTTARNSSGKSIMEISCSSWPTSDAEVLSGGIYVENGFLKVKP